MSMIQHIDDVPGYPAPHSPYSHAVIANGFAFVSGQIPVRPGGGPMEVIGDTMPEQTRQALRNVQAILEAAGSSFDRVVKVTVLLARPDLYRDMNEAYAEAKAGVRDGPLRSRHHRRTRFVPQRASPEERVDDFLTHGLLSRWAELPAPFSGGPDMQCPGCQQENPLGGRFATYAGL